jgi:UDP-D-galactose:(glucosyl)LPS alpha-1,3-D-galactosyltransferase
MADALPEYDSALYLDSDLLIIGDLLPLLHTKLDSTLIAAVRDPFNPVLKYGIGLPGWNELGIDGDREYFNSGVMLLNLRECRKQEVLTRSISFLKTNPRHIMFWDQDALNWAVADNWFRLDRHWNTVPISAILKMSGKPNCAENIMPLTVLIKEERNARIMHYVGSRKPWGNNFPNCAARDQYVAVLDEVDLRESQEK